MRALRRSLPLVLAVLPVVFAAGARAQLAEGGARSLGLGRAATALPGDGWGEFNPASPATLATRQAGLFASQAFGLSELRLVGAAVAVPLDLGTVAAHGRSYGFATYRENRFGLTVARGVPLSASRQIDLGLRAEYFGVAIDGYGSTGTFALSAGAQVDVLPTLRAGFHARNANRLGASDESDLVTPLSTAPELAVGLAFQASSRALVLLDAAKDLNFPLALRAGIEVQVVEALALRGGVQTGVAGDGRVPTRLAAGLGVRVSALRADLAVEHHATLGLTPAVSLGVDF